MEFRTRIIVAVALVALGVVGVYYYSKSIVQAIKGTTNVGVCVPAPSKAGNGKVLSTDEQRMVQERGMEFLRLNDQGSLTINGTSILSVSTFDGTLENIFWDIVKQPEGSIASLCALDESNKISFSGTQAGEYVIRISAEIRGLPAELETNYFLDEYFPYDPKKIEGIKFWQDPASVDGIITNQMYVVSETMNKEELINIINKYPHLRILGFERGLGVLVQFDETDPQVFEEIEKLRLEPGISDVFNRVHRGKNVPRSTLIMTTLSA